jgi:hypothetical protein
LAEETQSACRVADRIHSVETEIRNPAPQTYLWARRPLLLVCLLLLLTAIVVASLVSHRHSPNLAQQSGGAKSALSDAAMKNMLAQQQAFSQQMHQMQAEAFRRETQRTQERIAAAERTYREQVDRARAEQEKLLAERAAADRIREAQETERRKAAEEKRRRKNAMSQAWRFQENGTAQLQLGLQSVSLGLLGPRSLRSEQRQHQLRKLRQMPGNRSRGCKISDRVSLGGSRRRYTRAAPAWGSRNFGELGQSGLPPSPKLRRAKGGLRSFLISDR